MAYKKQQIKTLMNTNHDSRTKEGKPISLNPSETIALERPQAGNEIELIVNNGVIRIAAYQSKNVTNLTLGFASKQIFSNSTTQKT